MYEAYYQLNSTPFQLRPDPAFYFGSKGHRRAMAYLNYGVAKGEGFIVVTGEIGAGKTMLMRTLLRQLASGDVLAAQVVSTNLDAEDMLRTVSAAFALPYTGLDKTTLLANLEALLRHVDAQGKRALLVVDEAQNLTPHALEELRMLSNFEAAGKPLLQTFLLGQPEFRQTLLSPRLEQLRQRVIASYHLAALDADETRTYIEHRLRTAGWRDDPAIADEAFLAIHTYSGGVPRKINALCDRLLLLGFLEELHRIESTHVDEVAHDMAQEFAPLAEVQP